jgi:UDP-N-acetylglucosamine transferase subunit ALG13
MIFVTVGTTDFDDLVRAMDELAPTLGEIVVAQTGRGSYVATHLEHFRFAPTLDPYYAQARLVVAHGGLGTAVEVLQRGLKLIGVSNPDRYDLHQEDLLRALEQRGHMIWCRRLEELPQALRDAATRDFTPYETPPCHIATVVRAFLGLPPQDEQNFIPTTTAHERIVN